MKISFIDRSDLISIISFLSSFKLACSKNRIHGGEAMWIFYFFLEKEAAAALRWKITFKSKSSHKPQKEETLTANWRIWNYLLKTFFIDEWVAKADAEIMKFNQPLNKTPIEYANLLWAKMLGFDRVYGE